MNPTLMMQLMGQWWAEQESGRSSSSSEMLVWSQSTASFTTFSFYWAGTTTINPMAMSSQGTVGIFSEPCTQWAEWMKSQCLASQHHKCVFGKIKGSQHCAGCRVKVHSATSQTGFLTSHWSCQRAHWQDTTRRFETELKWNKKRRG